MNVSYVRMNVHECTWMWVTWMWVMYMNVSYVRTYIHNLYYTVGPTNSSLGAYWVWTDWKRFNDCCNKACLFGTQSVAENHWCGQQRLEIPFLRQFFVSNRALPRSTFPFSAPSFLGIPFATIVDKLIPPELRFVLTRQRRKSSNHLLWRKSLRRSMAKHAAGYGHRLWKCGRSGTFCTFSFSVNKQVYNVWISGIWLRRHNDCLNILRQDRMMFFIQGIFLIRHFIDKTSWGIQSIPILSVRWHLAPFAGGIFKVSKFFPQFLFVLYLLFYCLWRNRERSFLKGISHL